MTDAFVKFVKSAKGGMYGPGDVAKFEEAQARTMVASGVARFYDPEKKEIIGPAPSVVPAEAKEAAVKAAADVEVDPDILKELAEGASTPAAKTDKSK